MRIVKAGLKGLKASQLVGKSEHVEGEMTANANFATPSPDIIEVKAARTALVAAIAAAEGGAHAAIASKNEAAKRLSTMLVKLARYVNSVAGGDVDKAVSSGFELAKVPDPIDKLDAPTKFEGTTSAIAGQVELRWKGVRGARLYQTYICDGDPTSDAKWTPVGMTSKARLTVKGLTTDRKYSFRVAALGVVGEGPLSDTVTAKAA
ncbi:MAG: fibronectin type III domain-containing protein [Flavobacteriales bacterium]|nr:fibronectin type III domain-containing protein [Flavobacteriales bacterium]